MSQDLLSTAPTSFARLLALAEAAAAEQSPAVQVFPFELGQYQPGTYVTLEEIDHEGWVWASIGSFSQEEHYDICGHVRVFTGDTVTSPNVAVEVMEQAYAAFQACVMTPAMSNRDVPILGGSPQVFLMEPKRQRHRGSPGIIDGNPAGWESVIEWALHFQAYVTPG